MKRFGEMVKDARLAKRLYLEQLAAATGTHKGYLSGIENGKVRPPSVKILRPLSKVLGIPLRTLLLHAWVEKAPAEIRAEVEELVGRKLENNGGAR